MTVYEACGSPVPKLLPKAVTASGGTAHCRARLPGNTTEEAASWLMGTALDAGMPNRWQQERETGGGGHSGGLL